MALLVAIFVLKPAPMPQMDMAEGGGKAGDGDPSQPGTMPEPEPAYREAA